MKKQYLFLMQILMVLSLILAIGCSDNDKPVVNPPTCSITAPLPNAQFNITDNVPVTVIAESSSGTISEVRLYIDNVEHSVKTTAPYNFTINAGEMAVGTHTLKAVAKDNLGITAEATVNISIIQQTLTVGMSYQGGIIAYLDHTGQHGLIAAPSDLSEGVRWHNGTPVVTGATATAIGTGMSNTDKIIQVQGAGNYAAKLCYDLVLNGYNDWFLPSKDELTKLYENRNVIGGFNTTHLGLYWCSSELNISEAWYMDFSNGHWFGTAKGFSQVRVRAVRAF